MKNNDKKNLSDVISTSKKVLNIIYILLIVLACYIGIIIIKELGILKFLLTVLRVLTPLFLGIVIAWLLNPFVKWLESKKIRRGLGTAFAYLILIGCILLLIKSIIPLLSEKFTHLLDSRHVPGENEEEHEREQKRVVDIFQRLSVENEERDRNNNQTDIIRYHAKDDYDRQREQSEIYRSSDGRESDLFFGDLKRFGLYEYDTAGTYHRDRQKKRRRHDGNEFTVGNIEFAV